jgi:hypothetical protein
MTKIAAALKPFAINQTDIQFILDQIGFIPLFDATGNAIINWNGTGKVYDSKQNVLWDPAAAPGTYSYHNTVLTSANVLDILKTSYQSTTDLAGLRDVSGLNNNLSKVNAAYGAVDQIFTRSAAADYVHYSPIMQGVAAAAYAAAKNYYTSYATDPANAVPDFRFNANKIDYKIASGGSQVDAHGNPITILNVVDYTPRMISLTTTTAGVVYDTWANHQLVAGTILYTSSGTPILNWNGIGAIYNSTGGIIWDGVSSFTGVNGLGQPVTWTNTDSDNGPDTALLMTPAEEAAAAIVALQNVDWAVVYDINGVAIVGWNGIGPIYDALSVQLWDGISSFAGTDINALPISWTNTDSDNGPDTALLITPAETAAAAIQALSLFGSSLQPNPDAAGHTTSEIYYTNGVATVLDWGQLATVADGGQGQVDPQGRLLASAGQDDHFIGGLNPGVSPSNGFFVLFGQFFDHGLDFIDKSSGKTIKIALDSTDPLYGMKGPDGQPVYEITISRATVDHVDANGNPQYANHTSPFIDQSQTYGSHDQLTTLLREWVPDTTTAPLGDFHAGMKLFDGATLVNGWKGADYQAGDPLRHDTLPNLSELRFHIEHTGRDGLTWEDVSNLRNRGADGHLTSGTSGSALILDMNPRFDQAHLSPNDLDANGVTTWDSAVAAKVENAVAILSVSGATGSVNLAFSATRATPIGPITGIQLVVTNGAGAPYHLPDGTYTGATALSPWVNFTNFGITATDTGIHTAVGEILMASVGDHYIAGDGRVNENFGLTSIHHIFHEEHNYQVQNLIDALHAQDVANPDGHVKLHEFQVLSQAASAAAPHAVGVNFVAAVAATGSTPAVAAHWENAAHDYVLANGDISWDMDKVFNGAKLIVEMEYQHAAVDQYARNVTPNIQEFVGYSPDKDPSISLEYAQAAFRFGHSTLRETIDTIDPTHGLTGKIMGYALKEAFLSPEKYAENGPASIILGMSHQQMNEVDEFVTPALNQGLLGQPLDLASINIARGRDLGIPTLNDFRAALGMLKYTSWTDFGQNMQHASSLVNFIAAYSFDGDPAKAQAVLDLVDGVGVVADNAAILGWTAAEAVAKAFAFLEGGDQGFNHIDTWLGGLAEIHQPGGLLGETFDKVFVNQIESLMDGDRFYYLFRLAGQQFAEEVGGGQLKDIVERNTGLEHLNGNIFGYSDKYYDFAAHKEVSTDGTELQTTENSHKYGDVYNTTHNLDGSVNFETIKLADGALTTHLGLGIYSNGGRSNAADGTVVTINTVDYIRDTRLENGVQTNLAVVNASFEANSLAVGTPDGSNGVFSQVLGNYTYSLDSNFTQPTGWTITGGAGGIYAPVASVVAATGHSGGGVAWLMNGAVLSKDMGATLEEGHTYSLSFNVGDRTDQAGWMGGEARLIATKAGFPDVVLSTTALATLGEGKWNHITFDTGNIDLSLAGYSLRIEVQQGGGINQVLVDNVELTSAFTVLNGGVNLDDTPNSGAESNEVMVGTGFNDLIYAQGGDDTVYGEAGNDTIYGGYGIDRLYGGAGADTMYGGDNPDLMDGGSGDDFLYGESSGSDINGNDQLIGGSGNDFVSGGIGIDKLSGGTGDDRIMGDQDTDPFTHGSDGNDIVEGNSGGDILYGDNGDDLVDGGADQDQLFGGNGDDILRPGNPTGALTIGTDEVLGNDGVDVNDAGFDLIDFSDNTFLPNGVTFDLSAQVNPAVTVNGTPSQVQSFQMDGVIGSSSNDTITGDDATTAGGGAAAAIAGNNWLIGGSGNDSFMGSGGNDVIVGGSIRLDALIGKYNSGYTHNNENVGLSIAEQLQDAQYQGASHRVLYSETIDTTGIIDAVNATIAGTNNDFQKHFTEMLRSDQFKGMVLGDGGVDGTADVAAYSGNLAQYTVTAVNAAGQVVANVHQNWASIVAFKVADNRTANDLLDNNGDPILDANGNPITLDGTDMIIGVENLKFADQTINLAVYFDKAPAVDLNFAPASVTVVSDNFSGTPNNNAYGRGTGWGNNNSWTENGDANNNASTTGQILVDTAGAGGTNNGLHITGGTPAGSFNGASISRAVNLSTDTAATLSFSVQQLGLGAGENVKVYLLGATPTASDVPLYTIQTGADAVAATHTIPLTGPFPAGARLYFVSSAMNATTDDVYIDNIAITAVRDTDVSGITVGYTELQALPVVLTTTPHVSDPDDTLIYSATVHARETVAGDQLTLSVALPPGIVATGSGTGNLVLTSALGATFAQFEAALQAVRFANSGINPTNFGANLTRHLDVTVNDGLRNSAVATTLVNITANDTPTVTGADNVITNFGGSAAASTGQTFVLPDWVLLNNDSDPDSTLIITSVANVSTSLQSITHTGTNVTIHDNATLGGSFTYAVNGVTGNATLTQQTGTTLAGTAASEILIGTDATLTINGGGGNDIIFGNGGSDTLSGGTGDDKISYTVTTGGGGAVTSGRDFIDGGTTTLDLNSRDTGSDTFILNGANGGETFKIMTIAEALLHNITGLNTNTEIVITRQTGNNVLATNFTNMVVLAELDNIEEIQVNTLAVTANNANGGLDGVTGTGNGDTVQILGAFGTTTNATTSLNFNTITVNGGGNDKVDISGLTSDHRLVFNGATNPDQIIGDLRPQDVVNLGSQTPVDTSVHNHTEIHSTPSRDKLYGNNWDHKSVINSHHSGDGADTLDMSAIVANITSRSGDHTVTASLKHNYIDTAAHTDTMVFNSAAHGDSDTILNFEAGDKIDVHGIMQGHLKLVTGLTATAGQIAINYHDNDGAPVTVHNDVGVKGYHFDIDIKGHHTLTGTDFAA